MTGAQQDFDGEAIRRAVRMILAAIGEDPDRPGLRDTPGRVARAYEEIFAGVGSDPAEVVTAMFEEGHDEIVMERRVPFHSMCEHHLLPFFGRAGVAYIPNGNGQVTGLSKLARVVHSAARRPTMQERMTEQVADALESALDPRGVLVVLEARHLCMEMRGVRAPGAVAVTSAVRGTFREDPRTRSEAFSLLAGEHTL